MRPPRPGRVAPTRIGIEEVERPLRSLLEHTGLRSKYSVRTAPTLTNESSRFRMAEFEEEGGHDVHIVRSRTPAGAFPFAARLSESDVATGATGIGVNLFEARAPQRRTVGIRPTTTAETADATLFAADR